MTARVRAVRGATTLDEDTPEQVTKRVQELVTAMLEDNELGPDALISILFTASPDVHSGFPATAARALGLDDVPLMGAQEMDVAGALPLCVRVMMHVETERARHQVHHIYLHGAQSLRPDLAE
jgi:chorismate mutase